ncbi:ribosome-binding factor A [Candidatus Kaiserbacteria bacterium]|nr:ribosome-binding factor A [Candidatus Kaiserbacteria bacterium]
MAVDRNIKLAGLIKELVATYVRNEANSDPLITITNIDLSPDARRAIVFATTIPDDKEQDAVVFLKRNGTEIRNYLKKKARLKNIPHLEFMVDAGERHRQHIDELTRKIESN